MPCPAAEEAVKFSIAHPEYAIGVHLTMTSEWGKYRWKPLTDGKTLIDEEGFMWHESDQVEKNASICPVRVEMRGMDGRLLLLSNPIYWADQDIPGYEMRPRKKR